MRVGLGRLLKTRDGRTFFARVRVKVVEGRCDGLRIETAGVLLTENGHPVDPKSPYFPAYVRAAEHGVRRGADLAGVASGTVEIELIEIAIADTTTEAVVGAAALAMLDVRGLDDHELHRRAEAL